EGHYLDDRGLIVPFSATDPADDNNTKLSEMNPQKLSSGVVYIVRPNAQPDPGTAIGSTDIIRIMSKTYSHLAVESNGSVSFTSPIAFRSSVDGTGVPEVDPKYYFVSDSEASNAGKQRIIMRLKVLGKLYNIFVLSTWMMLIIIICREL